MIAERSKKKLSLYRNQKRVVEYSSCLLSAINDAILLYTVVAMGPIPPTCGEFVNFPSLWDKA